MRADKYFAEKFGSRTKARDALRQGLVLRGDTALSPDDNVSEGDSFSFIPASEHYVSRGGFKLARGLDAFRESVRGQIFADLGASTGGFTDCLLQRGAKHVFCVDVGESQLDLTLASDKRVTVMDKTNARYLTRADFPEGPDGVVADLSFISLRNILPAVCDILPEGGRAFVLFKPQFETGSRAVGKNGIVPQKNHHALLADFYEYTCMLRLFPHNIVNAPLHRLKNVEYVIFLRKNIPGMEKNVFLCQAQSFFEHKMK